MQHQLLSSIFGASLAVLVWAIATGISVAGWSTSRRSSSTSSLYSTIVGMYADPPPLTEPIISKRDGREAQLRTLRAVRVWAKHQEELNGDWARDSATFGSDGYLPENRAAYLIANSLNDLGSAAFTGGVPLATIIGIVGDVVIDDWLVCRYWVSAYRRRESVASAVDPEVAYHRRYGEWLAMLCLLMFEKEWDYKPAKRLADTMNGSARRRFLALTRVDRNLLPLHVLWELVRICPVGLKFQILLLPFRPRRAPWPSGRA